MHGLVMVDLLGIHPYLSVIERCRRSAQHYSHAHALRPHADLPVHPWLQRCRGG